MKIDIENKNIQEIFDIEQYCRDKNIDINQVKKLCCRNNYIIELKGLDKLVNLVWLYCDNNKLTELKGLDKLVNLEVLDCSSNKLTELKGLDKLVNLEVLYCYQNKITDLKLNKLTNLKELKK